MILSSTERFICSKEKKKNFLPESPPAFHQSWQSHQRGFYRGSSSVQQHHWVEGSWEQPFCAAGTWIRRCALQALEPLMHCAPKPLHRTERKKYFLLTREVWTIILTDWILLLEHKPGGSFSFGFTTEQRHLLEKKTCRHETYLELRVRFIF